MDHSVKSQYKMKKITIVNFICHKNHLFDTFRIEKPSACMYSFKTDMCSRKALLIYSVACRQTQPSVGTVTECIGNKKHEKLISKVTKVPMSIFVF